MADLTPDALEVLYWKWMAYSYEGGPAWEEYLACAETAPAATEPEPPHPPPTGHAQPRIDP